MIFVDTNAWVALVDDKDKFHPHASSWFHNNSEQSFITSNLVILETLGWLRYNRGKKLAVESGKRLLLSPDIKVERVSQTDETGAWKLFQKLGGRGVSMVDCTSFVVMKRLKVKEVFTFDQDFQKLGFKIYP